MIDFPDVKIQGVDKVNWRSIEDFDSDDDDEELSKTPLDVVDMLGFDPLHDEVALDAD